MAVVVRRVEVGDAARMKRVRLAALQDSPSAFGSTYEKERELTDEDWGERVALAASGTDRAHFLALDGDDTVGLIGIFDLQTEHHVVSMWTAPSVRRRGVGHMLVRTAVDWAIDTGASVVGLWVTNGNEPAQRLYESMGFVVTGEHQPLPSDPCKDETRMVLKLR